MSSLQVNDSFYKLYESCRLLMGFSLVILIQTSRITSQMTAGRITKFDTTTKFHFLVKVNQTWSSPTKAELKVTS